MIRSCLVSLTIILAMAVSSNTAAAQDDGWRTIEFETTEVTAADVALSPDGESLIFTLLGHLFRLPVEGGDAVQLTFGPYYDARPAVSPDGTRIAFQSDRDGSEGNIFLLEVNTGEITQLTDEPWADAPSWAPDGSSVVFLRLVREAWNQSDVGPNRNPRRPPPPAMVRRVWLDGGALETLRAELGEVRSPFHLPDGRVGWAVVERDTDSPRATTRIEVMDRDGDLSTVRTLDGVVDAVVASNEEFFVRRYIPVRMRWDFTQQQELVRVPRAEGRAHPILPVSDLDRWDWNGEPRFARSGDDGTLYVGNLGRLWRVTPNEGDWGGQNAIPFRARVRMKVRDPVPPPKWTAPEPGATRPPTSVSFPRLSPDGKRLFFMAANYLWEQPMDDAPIRQLTTSAGEGVPIVSPEGSRVAFEGPELRVLEVATGQTRSLLRLKHRVAPTWTTGGQQLIVWEEASDEAAFRLLAVDLAGSRETLTEVRGEPSMHTTLSPDGQWLFFVTREAPNPTTVFRLSLLDRVATPEPVTQLAMEFEYGRVSPDGQWFAYGPPNRLEIRVVPLGGERVSAEDSRLLSPVGSTAGFAFTQDGSAVVYAGTGNSVWRHPLNGDGPVEIPVRLELERPAAPPPTLIRRVRMLDFGAGSFGSETSMLIAEGRIRWTGVESDHQLPPGTVILDAGGRFAIPGLFDMHSHWCDSFTGRGYLSRGVTSVRNMGDIAVEVTQAADWEFTSQGSPRCFYAGSLIEGEQGRNIDWMIHPTDEADARAQVRIMHGWGVSFIKLYYALPWPLHRAAADEARQLGLPVVAHGIRPEEVIKGVTLGYLLLAHTPFKGYDDFLRLLAAVGMRTDPTLVVKGGAVLKRREPERFYGRLQPIDPLGDDALLGYWTKRLASVQRAYQLGVTLLPGTDGYPPQVWLHWELEFFAEAGIPPIDILWFATQASAETLGAGDDLGTLEVGKLADIVLLDANPSRGHQEHADDLARDQGRVCVRSGGVAAGAELKGSWPLSFLGRFLCLVFTSQYARRDEPTTFGSGGL